MEKLAKRAVACDGWRWLPGMLALHRNHHGAELGRERVLGRDAYAKRINPALDLTYTEDPLPDLSDPATLGCLLALVFEEELDWGGSSGISRRA